MVDVSIVVPTFREAENLRVLIPLLAEVLGQQPWTWEVVVVDDASPDATEAVCAELATQFPVRLIVRRGERGLSSAVIRGMHEARGQVLVCMDADLSHPPEAVPELVRPLLSDEPGPDFLIGSRYVPGGRTEDDWGLFRWINSQVATWLARPLVNVRDPMAGFFALRRADFVAHAGQLNPVGYKIALELIVKCECTQIREIPIHFHNRLHGESKLCLREQLNYLRHLARLYAHRYRELSRIVQFGLVGLSGVAVDLSLLAMLLSLGIAVPVAAALAIWGAMTWNFVGNRLWTFGSNTRQSLPMQYLQFCASCLVGAASNWSTRVALTTWVAAFAERPLAAAGLGVLAGFAFNYVLCRMFVFRESPARAKSNTLKTSEVSEDFGSLAGGAASQGTAVEPNTPVSDRSTRQLERVMLGGLLSLVMSTGLVSGNDWPDANYPPPPMEPDDPQPAKAVTVPARSVRTSRLALDMSEAAIEQRLRNDAGYLASDELEGRGVRTKGLDLACEFIAREFAAAGLETAHYNGTPFHEFRLHAASNKGAVQELLITSPDNVTQALTVGADYHSLMVSPKGSFKLPVAFVGYGITDEARGYDDYEGVNVAGKAVVVLRHEPPRPKDETSTETEPRKPALVMTKIRNAVTHGAAAVILVTDLRDFKKQTQADAADAEVMPDAPETLLDVEFNTGYGTESLPVVHCRRRSVAEWIRVGAGKELDDIEAEIEKSQTPQSFDLLGFTVAGRVAVTRSGWTMRNVLGTLPGSGKLAEEYLVIGAHYDHLGRGGYGSLAIGANDVVHNGADDNASGTAVLLEVARQLSASQKPFNRSVLFIAFSAEELGLIGSRRYVQSPLVPLSHTVAMLNLDMVGRLRNEKLTVYGTGTASEWPTWLVEAATPHNLLIVPKPSGFGPSDHASFYERGVPVLHFFTGFHPEYHRPGDDAELLNISGMRRIAGLMADLVREIDASEQRPRITSVDEAAILANLGDVGASNTREPETGPRLGVILDTAELAEGVRVRQLIRFSPAEQAGLKPGDVILKLDDQPMKGTEDVQKYIAGRKRGQNISVEFDRKGTRRQIDLVL